MINVLGEDMDRALHAIEYQSEAFVHLYGKEEVKEKRKMGHVTFIGESFDQLNEMKARYEK